jgi:hypothetical protein
MATALIASGTAYRNATFTVDAGIPRKLTLSAGTGETKVPKDAQVTLYTVNSNGTETFTGYTLDARDAANTSLNVVAAGEYKVYMYASSKNTILDID